MYNWSELTFGLAEWCRVGLVTERTRAYETERDIQRGLLVGVAYKNLEATAYVFNPDDSKPIVVLSVASVSDACAQGQHNFRLRNAPAI